MTAIYSVTQITRYISSLFLKDRLLSSVKIRGEVSNCKYTSAGHIYFTIKDGSSQLSCVMFAGKRSGLDFLMTEGQSVIVTGNITIYERDGKYQLYADQIEREGTGELYEQFIKLRDSLQKEGLFDKEHKKTIPTYVKTIGIITASKGAALQDILNIMHRRNPYIKPYLYPAKVQGEGAAETLIAGISAMEKLRPDVIIIGRGGGSIEDLWQFNSEALARAIYDCTIPVISAVGHEVDYTICDFVSDLRAPTPSAAAELATYEFSRIESRLVDYHSELYSLLDMKIRACRTETERKRLKLNTMNPKRRLDNYRMQEASARDKLKNVMHDKLKSNRHRLLLCAEKMNGLSPLNKLKQGYAYITDVSGHNISSVCQITEGDILNIRMTDGTLEAAVTRIDCTEDKHE